MYKNIVSIEPADKYCFTIVSKDDEWMLCPIDLIEDLEQWYCGIKELMHDPCIEPEAPRQPPAKVMGQLCNIDLGNKGICGICGIFIHLVVYYMFTF